MVNPVNPVTVGGNEDEELLATYAGARRRIAALEQQLQAFSEVGNKRKSYARTCFLSYLNVYWVTVTLRLVLHKAECYVVWFLCSIPSMP